MIGIIHETLAETLLDLGGEELKLQVFRCAGLAETTHFRINRNYSDAEFHRLFAFAKSLTGADEAYLFDAFSARFLIKAQALFPRFFEMASGAEDFIRRQAAIHAVMGASLRDPTERRDLEDKFSVLEAGNGFTRVRYRSPNRLCGLYRSLARAVAAHYGESVQIDSECCAKQGGTDCIFQLSFRRLHEGQEQTDA